MPSLDNDMLRIKIINELELPHRQQLEAKQVEIDEMNQQVFEYKREVELMKAQLEEVKLEKEKDVDSLK